ncbi:MAG: GxxExxY protein [Verrucomicrobiaceae bacterium]|nr:GxxExxY protein [Verrucomicrobiaceae bacterium]
MKSKSQSADDPITHAFIGHAMKVHSSVGPGLDEEIYHQELVAALTAAGISHLSKPRRDLVYRGIVADSFEPDFVVENHFIPELKCLRGSYAPEHLVQVFCYCKFWRLRTSLLVDFGKQSLVWERLLYRSRSARFPDAKPPEFVSKPNLAETILQAVGTCLNETGLGYRQTTWKGLVSAAIQSAGIKIHLDPTVTVLAHPHITMPCLVIDETCAVFVTALTDGITATERSTLQTHLRWLNLEWGIVFHFGKTTADFSFVQHPKKKHSTDSGRQTD